MCDKVIALTADLRTALVPEAPRVLHEDEIHYVRTENRWSTNPLRNRMFYELSMGHFLNIRHAYPHVINALCFPVVPQDPH
jgi:hypothetical protein